MVDWWTVDRVLGGAVEHDVLFGRSERLNYEQSQHYNPYCTAVQYSRVLYTKSFCSYLVYITTLNLGKILPVLNTNGYKRNSKTISKKNLNDQSFVNQCGSKVQTKLLAELLAHPKKWVYTKMKIVNEKNKQ